MSYIVLYPYAFILLTVLLRTGGDVGHPVTFPSHLHPLSYLAPFSCHFHQSTKHVRALNAPGVFACNTYYIFPTAALNVLGGAVGPSHFNDALLTLRIQLA